MSTAIPRRTLGASSIYSGIHQINGTVKRITAPAEEKVYLLDEWPLKLVAVIRSVGGSYTFEKIKAGSWIVMSRDHTAQYNAVVVDRVVTG